MSKLDAELDRATAAYWLSVANWEGAGRSAALGRAADLLRDARAEAAESRTPGGARQPVFNEFDMPPLERPRTRRLMR